MTEFLPGMDVRKVDFNRWHPDRGDGIAQGNAGMGVSGSVQDYHIEPPFGLLDPGNQFPLQVGLAEVDFNPKLRSPVPNFGLDVRQCGLAINFRLPLAEQVKVWTVQELDSHAQGEI